MISELVLMASLLERRLVVSRGVEQRQQEEHGACQAGSLQHTPLFRTKRRGTPFQLFRSLTRERCDTLRQARNISWPPSPTWLGRKSTAPRIDRPSCGKDEAENTSAMNLFPKNEHKIERAVRVVVGLVALAMVFVGPKSLFGLIGIVPLATGLLGSCPLYTLFGISTCSVGDAPSKAG
jgi:hypothetical protein